MRIGIDAACPPSEQVVHIHDNGHRGNGSECIIQLCCIVRNHNGIHSIIYGLYGIFLPLGQIMPGIRKSDWLVRLIVDISQKEIGVGFYDAWQIAGFEGNSA